MTAPDAASLRRWWPPLLMAIALLAALQLAATGARLWQAGAPGVIGGDFIAYDGAARQVRTDGWHGLYDLTTQQRFQQRFLQHSGLDTATLRAIPFNYLPPALLLFLPLANAPPEATLLGWLLLNALLVPVACFVVLRTAPRQTVPAPLTPALLGFAFLPVDWGLLAGQPVGVMLALYALAVVALLRRHDAQSGFWLSVLAIIKPQMVVGPALALLVLRRWRALACLATGGALLGALSLSLVGLSGVADYRQLLGAMDGFRGNPALAVQVQNMANWHAWIARVPGISSQTGFLVTTLADALTLLLAVLAWRHGAPDSRLAPRMLLCFTAAGIAGSYHSHFQDLTLLLAPALAILATEPLTPRPASWARSLPAAATALLVALPGAAFLLGGLIAIGALGLWAALAAPGLLCLTLASTPWGMGVSFRRPEAHGTAAALAAGPLEVPSTALAAPTRGEQW